MNWGLRLLKCGWVDVRAHFSAWHICNLVWVRVPRVVCLAVFTKFVGHPLRSHGPLEQNELLATGDRLTLSRQSHVQPLCSLLSVTPCFKAALYCCNCWSCRWYWTQKIAVHIDGRLKCDTHLLCIHFSFKKSFTVKYYGVFFTLLTLKNDCGCNNLPFFPFINIEGHLLVYEGIDFSLSLSRCHSAVHSLTQTTAWRPSTYENQPWLWHVL